MKENTARRIVITGVSRGLGRALVEGFAARGHVVCGCARSAGAVAELCRQYPPPHDFAVVDVSSDTEVREWAKCALAGGPPDLLINNAGLINRNAPLWKVPEEEFSRMVDVNLKGVANVLRHFLPAMVKRGQGVIVNHSSGCGRVGSPELAPYCATKWAIEGLTRALAEELPAGMAAVPLIPGVINTDMLQTCMGKGANGYPDASEWAQRAVPMLLRLGPKQNGQPLSVPRASGLYRVIWDKLLMAIRGVA
jgi:NAD(P)-dependent dehydrogenase (short-subunit alcohol dehydrogenase family)